MVESIQNEQNDKILKHFEHKQKFLRIVLAAIILISGMLIGAGATILLEKNNLIWIEHKHKSPAEITKIITKKYGLNEQQTKQVEDILTRAFEQRKLDKEEMDKKHDAYAQIVIAEMKVILTPEQFESWNKDFQNMREKFKERKR